VEVDLCGHATLAAAHVLFQHEDIQGDAIEFFSPRSGPLHVRKKDDVLQLDFPADEISEVFLAESLHLGFQPKPLAAFKGKTDYLLLFENENQIQNLKFDIPSIAKVKARGIIVTAPGNEVDFVSRFFGPQVGVDEDPVTGSAHTTLAPFWSVKLGKKTLTAIQMSSRKGSLTCEISGNRVLISGKAVTYLIGEIFI
jgi:PhzF family phenazine biosynthesis protein